MVINNGWAVKNKRLFMIQEINGCLPLNETQA